VFDTNHFSEGQEFDILKTFYCPELDTYLVVTPDQGGTGFSLTAALTTTKRWKLEKQGGKVNM
jgi:hypothetical protein